jgi:hypothetical protein
MLALCGLVGTLLLGVLPIPSWFVHGNSIGRLLAREAIVWCCALAVLLWLTFVERLPLSATVSADRHGQGSYSEF